MATQKPKPKAKPSAKPQAKAAASKPKTVTAAKKPSSSKGDAGFHMESYLMGAAHGAQILFDHAKKQMGSEASGMKKELQSDAQIPGQVGGAMFGDKGLLPVGQMSQNVKSLGN